MARPLNKLKDGVPYARPAAIEARIDRALNDDVDTVLTHATIRNTADPDYMPTECLLHLAREARLSRDKRAESRLYKALMVRCEARLKKVIPDGSRPDASGKRDEVMQALGLLFARVGTNHDATVLDYYEVKFNDAFAKLRFTLLRKEQTREKEFYDFAGQKDEDGNPLDDENALARLSQAAQCPAQQENFVYLGEVNRFLATLSPEDREAVMLVAVRGYKIESEDPDEKTAATICGVSGRAIRKRLKKVATLLKQFQQES